ncbi:MAG: DEAD/DEAH box helicase [Victivallales bacterium]|nr:DEAD/DEAH box helicase [Victivallales bacterium]
MPVSSFSNKEWDSYLSLLSLIMMPATKQDAVRLFKDENIRKALPLLTDNMFLGSFTTENMAPPQRQNEVKELNDGQDNTIQVIDKRIREQFAYTVIHKHPAIADTVAEILPWQSSPNLRGCLMRDIRNYFYAKNLQSFLRSLKILLKNFPDAFKTAEPLAFLEHHINSAWISKLPPQLLSFAAGSFLPMAAANLWDTSLWEQSLLDIIDKTDESAKLALVDIFLLQGKIDKAEEMLKPLKGDSKELRYAWIFFMRGENEESIELYQEILDRMRKAPDQANAYFRSICGIFYIFALMKQGGKYFERAGKLAQDAFSTPYLGMAYRKLASHLGKFVLQPNPEAQKENTPLADYFSFFVDMADEQLGASQLLEDTARFNPLLENYPWLQKEMQAATANFRGAKTDLTSVLAGCFTMRPPWKRAIDKLNEILKKPRDNNELRLAWLCAYDENDLLCPVRIRPVEQRMSKRGHWNKGRPFPLAKCLDQQALPSFLSNHDKVICNIIAQEYNRSFSAEVRDAQGYFHLLQAVKALPGHPNLYWDNATPTPFQCKLMKPILAIREDGDQLQFGIYPQFNGNPYNFVTEKDTQGDLLLYDFSDMHKEILQEIGNSFHAPKSIASDSAQIIRPLAEAFRVFSYVNMDLLGIKPQKTDLTPHLRLIPGDDTMRVEMLMRPFPNLQEFYRPASGPSEMLTLIGSSLERYVRDFNAEDEQANIVILLCEVLNESNSIGQWSWELNSLDLCCQFTLALHNISKQVQVHWPENRKLRISRRISMKDVTMHCKSGNDWFSLDGTIKVDDGLLISMKEIIAASRKQPGNFLQLDDGQIIALADSFRKRLDDFAAVTYEDEESGMLRFNNFALPFMERLLQDCTPEDERGSWSDKANKIQKAMSLVPDLPSTLKATLRPYQREGYTWLFRLDAWHAGACLADDMGLGKTIQTIAFILSKANEGPVLIVAPTSVCPNWVQEINRFAPTLEPIVFGGLKRLKILQSMGPRKVLVASYGLLQSEAEEFDKIDWRIAVLDEAQAIKNHNTKRSRAAVKLNARFRIVTTGTPMENNLSELWSIFNFINPGLLGSHNTFQEQFAIPIEKNDDKDTLKRLTAIVSPFILRRRKSQVLTDLPPKTEVQLHVAMSEEEWTFYEALRSQLVDEIRGYGDEADHLHIRVIAAITKLRQAACNPRLILPDSPIASSKMNTFTELLEELISGGHKILVFSQFVKHLELVRPEIESRDIKYQYLDGSTPMNERLEAVKAFQAGEGDVFLISLKAGGLGLNLTAADYVIHLDPWWNPAVEDQASDRAYRIGQDKPVTIYRLITQNTIEDEILKLHQSKRDLADNLLAGTDTLEKVGIDELMRLLTTAAKRDSN